MNNINKPLDNAYDVTIGEFPTCIILHLDKLSFSNHTWHHSCMQSRSACSWWESSIVLITEQTLESSAKKLKFVWTILGISLIYNVNNSGPSTEPWGTPLVAAHQLEKEPFKTTL